MKSIEYNLDVVAFNQTNCDLCHEEYKAKDPVVELACRHILHEECYKLAKNCVWPQCQPVKVVSTPKSLDQEVDALFLSLKRIDSSLETPTVTLFQQEVQHELSQIYISDEEHARIKQQLEEISEAFMTPFSGTNEQLKQTVERHASWLVDMCEAFLNRRHRFQRPEIFLEHLTAYSFSLKPSYDTFSESDSQLQGYLGLVIEAMAKNEKMISLLKEHEEDFRQQQVEHLRPLSLGSRFNVVYHYDRTQRHVMGSSPEARPLVLSANALKCLMPFFACLCVSYIGLLFYRFGR